MSKPPADTVIYNAVMRRLQGKPADYRALVEVAGEVGGELGIKVGHVMEVMQDGPNTRRQDRA